MEELREKLIHDIEALLEHLEGGSYTIQVVAIGSSEEIRTEKTRVTKGRPDGKKPSDWYDDRVYYL